MKKEKFKADYINFDKSSIERQKELSCINQVISITKEGKSINETLQHISFVITKAWQYPEHTLVKIEFDKKIFYSCYPDFEETKWMMSQDFETIDQKKGVIKVFYNKKFPDIDEGPFLKEERNLIIDIANIITGFINSIKGEAIIKKIGVNKHVKKPEAEKKIGSRKLLQNFINKNNSTRDIFHDLMPFKVKEILLIANLYDAYSIEKEGRFSEYVLGEYSQLNLTSFPRITGVSSHEEVFEQLKEKHFDLIIIIMGANKEMPVSLSSQIKIDFPYIPVFLLLNNNTDISYCRNNKKEFKFIDKIFVWNGESAVFFSMIKYLEDRVNVANDTKIGLVRIILLVEDSAKYYSRYLPILYKIVLEQTRRIINDVSTDDLYKVLRLRARPKIILVSNYEEAYNLINKYKDFLLCVISDVKFEKNNKSDENAGFDLIKYAKTLVPHLPTIIQSSDTSNADKAHMLKSVFINKNSDNLSQDFESFISHFLGFGDFIYRDKNGRKISRATTLKEFETQLKLIPDDSLLYHARKDNFSMWLMARGEILAAKILNPHKVTEFDSPVALRKYLIDIIQKYRNEQNKGKIIPYEENAILDETNIISLADGSLGGKGRGVAFINNLINNYNFSEYLPDINIRSPKTAIIGTDEFMYFMQNNNLYSKALVETDYNKIKKYFLKAKLSSKLTKRIKKILQLIQKPIAVRSSGLLEDSLTQPFAGIFETFILPNNHPDLNVRLSQCLDAIKLVYASIFSKTSRNYIKAINYKLDEEKMAIVLQEVVGSKQGNYFYPHISGVAQSYNYYPFSHMKPEEGFGLIALGLGKYVVDGEKAFRFSPQYPNLQINTPKQLFKNSQTEFFAVDLEHTDIDLLEGDTAGLKRLSIEDAERHGTLNHLASVFDVDNERIIPGLTNEGPRIINFADILKYNYIPLPNTIKFILDIVKESIGSPVEIEFAVDLNKDENYKASFYLLQIKPLISIANNFDIGINKIDYNKAICLSDKAMGSGLINDIHDIIYINKDVFDKSKTKEMADEIEKINSYMIKENKKYILIGPGRWGTRDRWLGIPVKWPQISNAKIIVETSLDKYPLDASSGSHFFHNITSMNVGYFSVQHTKENNFISWNILERQNLVNKSKYYKHIAFKDPLKIMMDGKKGIAIISL